MPIPATNVDKLTSKGNRTAFDTAFEGQLERAAMEGWALSLALLDIDRFDAYNKTNGRECGDAVLVAMSNVLNGLGYDALPFRYGGDEFALLLPNTERERALLMLEKVRAEVEAMEVVGENDAFKVRFTISAGIAALPIDGSSANELLRKADEALYRAKVAGRNRVMLAYEEKMIAKTSHFTATQLDRLSALSKDEGIGEAALLREALDDLLTKYNHNFEVRQ
jgi:diguanylate cyclase (GGDEF)-like protein